MSYDILNAIEVACIELITSDAMWWHITVNIGSGNG